MICKDCIQIGPYVTLMGEKYSEGGSCVSFRIKVSIVENLTAHPIKDT